MFCHSCSTCIWSLTTCMQPLPTAICYKIWFSISLPTSTIDKNNNVKLDDELLIIFCWCGRSSSCNVQYKKSLTHVSILFLEAHYSYTYSTQYVSTEPLYEARANVVHKQYHHLDFSISSRKLSPSLLFPFCPKNRTKRQSKTLVHSCTRIHTRVSSFPSMTSPLSDHRVLDFLCGGARGRRYYEENVLLDVACMWVRKRGNTQPLENMANGTHISPTLIHHARWDYNNKT